MGAEQMRVDGLVVTRSATLGPWVLLGRTRPLWVRAFLEASGDCSDGRDDACTVAQDGDAWAVTIYDPPIAGGKFHKA